MAEEKKKRAVVRTRSPHHRVVYTNNIGATITGQDLRLRFGCVELGTPERLDVEDQVDVIMGPLEANNLLLLLQRNLSRFNIVAQPPDGTIQQAPTVVETKPQ